jgi:hypothetical protein
MEGLSVRTKTKFVSLVAVVSFAMAVIRTVIIQYDMEKNGIENETYYLPDNVEVSVFTVASVLFAALFFTDGMAPPQYSQCSQFARGHLHAKAKSVFTSEHCEHWERR